MPAFTFVRADMPFGLGGPPPAQIAKDVLFEWAPIVANGIPPYTFIIKSGTPLAWFVPNASTGAVSATPMATGAMNDVVMRVEDSLGRRAEMTINLRVVGSAEAFAVGLPKVVGLPRVGQEFYYSRGLWEGSGSDDLTRQWQRSSDGSTWSDISGATGPTYTAVAGDVGYCLAVLETPVGPGDAARSRASQYIRAAPTPTHYVDYASGSDAAAGTSAATAWKHAPGDAAATGNAAAYTGSPGDVIALKGGVRYPNTIHAKRSGTEKAPITYAGNLWGTGRAILDMSEALNLSTQVRAATSSADAGGVSNWADVLVIEHPSIEKAKDFYLTDDVGGLLMPGRYPAAIDAFFIDTNRNDAVEYIMDGMGDTNLSTTKDGYVISTALETRLTGQTDTTSLALWGNANVFVYFRDHSLAGSGRINFDDKRISHAYVPGRAFIWGDRHSVTEPGLFAVIADGKAIFKPRAGYTRLGMMRSKPAINFGGESYVHFDGFTVTGQMASGHYWSVDPITNRAKFVGASATSGAAFSGGGLFNVRVQDCADMPSADRGFVARLGKSTDFVVHGFSTSRIVFTGGVEYGSTTGFRMRYAAGNRMSGGGIRSGGQEVDSLVVDAIGTEMDGVHANYATHYANQPIVATDARLERVAVHGAGRPFTSQGSAGGQRPGDPFYGVMQRRVLEYRDCIAVPVSYNMDSTAMRLDSLMDQVHVRHSFAVSHKLGIGHAGNGERTNWHISDTTYGELALSAYWHSVSNCTRISTTAAIDIWVAAQTLGPREVSATGGLGVGDTITVSLTGKVPEDEIVD